PFKKLDSTFYGLADSNIIKFEKMAIVVRKVIIFPTFRTTIAVFWYVLAYLPDEASSRCRRNKIFKHFLFFS
ncbi:MAG: hypothetical protein ACI303_02025, partial [Lepagella sp.]